MKNTQTLMKEITSKVLAAKSKYEQNDFADVEDEKDAGGFWDIAGELAELPERERQSQIYCALQQLAPPAEKEFYDVLRVHRDDVRQELDLDNDHEIDHDTMERIADKLGDNLLDGDYWIALNIIGREKLNLN